MKAKIFVTSLICLVVIGIALNSRWSETGAERDRVRASSIRPANVLLVVVDTLGAKHLGVYDETLKHTPNLDQFAKNSSVFDYAYSTAPWTKPSISSILTGLSPKRHGVTGLNSKMPLELVTMSELLKGRDYDAAGIVSHTLIDPKTGYSQGFDSYRIVKFRGNVHDSVTSDQVTDLAIDWLEKRQDSPKPFFLFLHYFDPHFNYQHHAKFDQTSSYKGSLTPGLGFRDLRKRLPELTADDIQYLRGLYHEEIAFTDYHLGRLFGFLKSSGIDGNTLVVFTADHGEEFLEHGGIGHTRTLFDELIQVPLMISYPGRIESRRIANPVSGLDILPTILDVVSGDMTGLALEGRSLVGLPGGEGTESIRDLFAEVDFRSTAVNAYKLGVQRGPFKLLMDKPTQGYELYERSTDRDEKKNIFSKDDPMSSELKKALDTYREGLKATSPDEANQSQEELEQLRSLGYL